MIQEPYRLAAAAVHSQPGNPERNLDLIEETCRELSKNGVRLVLFPELSICGFLPNHPEGNHEKWLCEALKLVRSWAEPIPGPSTGRLVEIARETNLLIAAGLFEDAGPMVHNAHVLVGPDGILSVTRKMHIPIFEAPFYNGGSPPTVVDTPCGRIGVCICFDSFLPETTRLLAIQGAELVLFPFASDPEPKTAQGWMKTNSALLQIRCWENGFFGLVVNTTGKVEMLGAEMIFPGGGMFISPRGKMLKKWEVETALPGTMTAELDPALLDEARTHPEFAFRFRNPCLYHGLILRPGRTGE